MPHELEIQKSLKLLLQNYYEGTDTKIYQGKEIRNINKRTPRKVPDLIIDHHFKFYNPSYKKFVLNSPIGVEVKNEPCSIANMAKGMVDQLKESYKIQTYIVDGKEMKIDSLLFTNPKLIREGFFTSKGCYDETYHKHELYVAKRFAWGFNVGLIHKDHYSENLIISFHNILYDLFGNIKSWDTHFDSCRGIVWK